MTRISPQLPLWAREGGRVLWVLWALAAGCGAAAVLLGPGQLQLALAAIALTLALAGLGMVAGARLRGLRQRLHLRGLAAMIASDPAAAFVTDAGGIMRGLNQGMQARLTQAGAADILALFEGMTAHPRALLMRLQTMAAREGAAAEVLGPEATAQSLTVHPAGQELFLWRLTAAAPGREVLSDGLPAMLVDAGGRIVTLSPAMMALLGGAPLRLEAVVSPVPTAPLQRVLVRPLPGKLPERQGNAQPGGRGAGRGEGRAAGAGGGDARPMLAASLAGDAPGHRRLLLLPLPATGADADAASLEAGCAQTAQPEVFLGRDAYESLPVALVQLLPDGAILRANAAARRLLDQAAADPSGQKLADLVEGLGRSLPDWLLDVHAGRAASASEVVRLRGGPEDAFVQIALHRDPLGDGLIGILSDATAIKTLEAQFVQSQKMQAIGQLAGGVAHDFNNLLAAIAGHCDLLLLRHRSTDADYPDLVQISQNTNRAAALVGQLLAFSRKQTLKAEQIDPAEVLADMTHLLNRLVGARVQLSLDCDAGVGPIRADRRQLEQVLMNLVVNARDAMPEGGQVTIAARSLRLDAPLARDRARVPAGEYALITVSDQGVGIPPDRIDKIFEPFYTTKRPGEGTGLGLSTAYGIVKQTGGFIFADSTPGQGATFSLYFPVNHDPQAAVPAAMPAAAPARLGQGVVLLVEDEAPVRAFAARALSLRGYAVVEADSGEAALALLDNPELKVDVIVTDVIMPGLDGPAWVRRALPSLPGVRVVFMSGYTDEGFEAERASIPNSAFLAKPFALEALVRMVQGQNLH